MIISFREVASFRVKVMEINSLTLRRISDKFTILRPSSDMYFSLRIWEKIASNFWYRVRRGRFSISIALSKTSLQWVVTKKRNDPKEPD